MKILVFLYFFHMTAISTFCYNPSNKYLGTNLLQQRYMKNTSCIHRLSSSRSFTCRFIPFKLWVANSMDGFIRTPYRDEKSDKHVKVLKQEAFVDRSSEFPAKFLFQEVESTLNQLSKWIVTILFGVFIIWRHDAEALWFAAGSILNAMFSISLKQILNQKRPSTLKSDPGMPSSHAQSIFFTVIFIILSSVELLRINELTISGLALAFGSYLSYLRVSQKLHTVSQVVVGAVIGSICSILWYWLWNAFMLDACVSSPWVRIIVVLGTAGIWLSFFLHVIRQWLKDKLNET
ncbi:putative phosphatidate phosphatase [Medicago truncatula]|uniref:Putative phosphatidate phosphatase n=1 Tax=Medicago truncatula TaxID=3880 RepID=A0A396GRF0_MEDTR|nr:lipid phosphate phosphatase epsilon 1, chloroplastic isoform X2 [Medicago truncatula]RHN42074.1 putative phosphatidate phosphatase [Medicago truncatula]